MKNELTFNESQKFNQWWLWLVIFIIDAFIFMTIYNFIKNESVSIVDSPNGIFLLILLLVFLLINYF